MSHLTLVPTQPAPAAPLLPDVADDLPCTGRWWGPYGCTDARCINPDHPR